MRQAAMKSSRLEISRISAPLLISILAMPDHLLIFTIGGNSGGGVLSARTFPIIRIVMPITLPPDAVLPFPCIRGHFAYYPFFAGTVRLGEGAGHQPSLLSSACTVLPGSGRRFSLRYCAGEQPTRRVNSVIRLLLLG